MEETRKCQYCAEEIKVKAKLCKHCSKDLTTDEAISLKHRIEVEEAAKKRKEEKMKKKAEERKLLEEQRIQDEEKRKQNEQKRQKLILELSEKIDMYPEDMRKDIENDLSALKSLKEMDKEQIEKDISDKLKEEKKEAKKLLLIIVIAFLALTYIVTYFLFSTMLHHILFGVCLFGAVWSFP